MGGFGGQTRVFTPLAQVEQRVHVLVPLVLAQVSEQAGFLRVVDPVDLEDFEASTADKFVQFGKHGSCSLLVQVLGNRACLDNHAQQVQVVSLLDHQFVRRSKLLLSHQLVGLQVDLRGTRFGLGLKLLAEGGDLGL